MAPLSEGPPPFLELRIQNPPRGRVRCLQYIPCLCSSPQPYSIYPLKTITGSRVRTFLIEKKAASKHVQSITRKIGTKTQNPKKRPPPPFPMPCLAIRRNKEPAVYPMITLMPV